MSTARDLVASSAPVVPARRLGKLPHWSLLLSELVGTGLLVAVGLSIVILDFGRHSFVVSAVPDAGARRAMTGFLFGWVGALITFSAVGKSSGAHINPVVSLAFWMERKLSLPMLAGYVAAQLVGAMLGAFALLSWGQLGGSVHYGATIPGPQGALFAAVGEAVTTFFLVIAVFTFLGTKRLRKYTPLVLPPLYAIMVYLEAPLSGTSTNPARSFGPAVASGDWQAFWVYCVGPLVGTLGAIALRRLPLLRPLEVEIAKVYHFDRDPHHVFRSVAPATARTRFRCLLIPRGHPPGL